VSIPQGGTVRYIIIIECLFRSLGLSLFGVLCAADIEVASSVIRVTCFEDRQKKQMKSV